MTIFSIEFLYQNNILHFTLLIIIDKEADILCTKLIALDKHMINQVEKETFYRIKTVPFIYYSRLDCYS